MDRSHESPMEFEYENKFGPSDPTSPWTSAPHLDGARKRHLNSPHASPSKNVPRFGAPSSQPFFFSTPARQPPSTPHQRTVYQTPAFTTPRNFDTPGTDVSMSGAEDSPCVPKSPEEEKGTPEMSVTTSRKSNQAKSTLAKKPARFSLGSALFGLNLSKPKKTTTSCSSSSSSSKELVLRSSSNRDSRDSKKPYADGAAKKVHKRRQKMEKEGDHFLGGSHSEEGGSGDDTTPYAGKRGSKSGKAGNRTWSWGSYDGVYQGQGVAADWVQTHRDIPSIISQYLQLGINISIGALLVYLAYGVVSAIQHDIADQVQHTIDQVQFEIAHCRQEFVANMCDKHRLRALEEKCKEWELCMNRDAGLVGRASVTAETFAHIINSFVEHITYKSMIFCFLMAFGGIFATNFAFGFFRAKQVHHPNPFLAAAIPRLADQYAGHQAVGWTPSAQNHPAFRTPSKGASYISYNTPGRTPGWDADSMFRGDNLEEDESPVPQKKRLLKHQ